MHKTLLICTFLLLAACDQRNNEVQASKPTDKTHESTTDRRNAPTPFDQSNDKADVDHLAQVRQAVTADDQLSVSAKNVQIMTRNGLVTLKGTVPTSQERSRIEDLARGCAATKSIDNQIEVESK